MTASFFSARASAMPHALPGLVAGIVLGTSDVGGAGDWAAGEAQSRHNWFQSLMEPGTDAPCCDEADCTRTVAVWRSDGWWALVRGRWRSIPEASLLKAPHSIDGEAYVCSGNPPATTADGGNIDEPRIYCFVPPDLGS